MRLQRSVTEPHWAWGLGSVCFHSFTLLAKLDSKECHVKHMQSRISQIECIQQPGPYCAKKALTASPGNLRTRRDKISGRGPLV